MKTQIKKYIARKAAVIAYNEAEKNVNSLCLYWHHQPKVPEALSKLKK